VGGYTIDVWQVEQGLPQISVSSIAQTPSGYLWFGTFNGLVRFDGLRFTVFNAANTPALRSSSIFRLLTDPEGGLWILTEEGHLTCLVGDEFTAFGPENGLPVCGAAALVVDLEGDLWVVDREGGLHGTSHRRLSRREPGHGGAGEKPRLLVAPSEPCWVEFRDQAVNAGHIPLSFPMSGAGDLEYGEFVVPCATPSRGGGHWLATKAGILRLREGHLQGPIVSYPEPLPALTSIAEDNQGNLWVGSWALGLFRRSATGQWQRFHAEAGLAENDVTAVFVDRENNIWVGTGHGGLHRLKPGLFKNYDTSNGLRGGNVRSVAEDREGRILIGVNGGGLHCWENERITPVTEPPELQRYPLVYSVLADRQGAVWVGLYGGTALRLHAGVLTPFVFLDAAPTGMTPRALFEDHSGTIWLGCDGGLLRHDAGRLTLFNRQNGLTHDQVHALAQDRQGTLYLGTYGGGLNYFISNVFRSYRELDGLPDNHTIALFVDRDDTLWIGMLHGGLSRLRDGRFAGITTRDGLPSNTIGSILEDDFGNFWLGSNRGIVRLGRQELSDYLDGKGRMLRCRVFDRSDGLNTVDCSGGGQPASCKASDGRLWFATVKGAAVLDPTQVPVNPLPPPVIIEEVLLNDVPVFGEGSNEMLAPDRRSGLRIPPGRHRLELLFTGVSLEAPEKVRFRYRLEGLDTDWTQPGSRRTATYGPVPPGTYRFEVTACNKDGVWNELGAALPITVLPHFWQTIGFRISSVLALCAATGLLVRLAYRRRMERRLELMQHRYALEGERRRIAQDIHDDLGARLTQLGLLAEFAKRSLGKPEATRSYLQQMTQRSRDMTQAMDEVVWAVDPARDSVEGLLNYLGPLAQEFFLGTTVRCRLDFPPVLPPQTVSAKARHGLLLVVKEALNNCLKHSRASEVLIRSRLQGSVLSLQIEDDGSGFDGCNPEVHRGGRGIQSMRRRVEGLGGEFALDGRTGSGTRIFIKIDLARMG
jgi:ligand-binding sensor domain-containing protein/two-component sensor histidine kinase